MSRNSADRRETLRAFIEPGRERADMVDPSARIDVGELGHELRALVDDVLGFTGTLIEDAKDIGALDLAPSLQEIHRSGWKILERIDVGMAALQHDTCRERFESLEKSVRLPAQELLHKAESLAVQCRESGREQMAVEADYSVDTVRRIISLLSREHSIS